MNIKVLAIDMDGTTVKDDGFVGEENIKAIQKAIENGVLVVPTTGRTYYEMPQEILDEKSIRYSIFSNGAGIKDNEKLVYKNTLDYNLAKEIFQLLNSYESMTEVYTNGHPVTDVNKLNKEAYEYYKIDPVFHIVLDETRIGVEDFQDFYSEEKDTEMFNVFFRYENERADCMAKLKEYSAEIEVTTSMDNNLEILKKGVNKGTGLVALCDILGITLDEIIAIGDSSNDKSMFKIVGHPVAVMNACDELKQMAKDIICSNNESAIAYAINKYILTEN